MSPQEQEERLQAILRLVHHLHEARRETRSCSCLVAIQGAHEVHVGPSGGCRFDIDRPTRIDVLAFSPHAPVEFIADRVNHFFLHPEELTGAFKMGDEQVFMVEVNEREQAMRRMLAIAESIDPSHDFVRRTREHLADLERARLLGEATLEGHGDKPAPRPDFSGVPTRGEA